MANDVKYVIGPISKEYVFSTKSTQTIREWSSYLYLNRQGYHLYNAYVWLINSGGLRKILLWPICLLSIASKHMSGQHSIK